MRQYGSTGVSWTWGTCPNSDNDRALQICSRDLIDHLDHQVISWRQGVFDARTFRVAKRGIRIDGGKAAHSSQV